MNKQKLNVGLIGYGYWGNNILRNLLEQTTFGKVVVCDINPERLEKVKAVYSGIQVTNKVDELLTNPNIQAIIIATPTSTHFDLAKKALLHNKHVLVEKPISTSVTHAEELISIAASRNLILMVDHIYLYNPVVKQLKKYLNDDFIGKINYIDATRINLGIYQEDTNVLWDLACHDISIVNYLINEQPSGVRAIGKLNMTHSVEDVAYLFLYYPSGLLVQINSSWASPVKMRKMIIGGTRKMIIYDDIESTNKLIIYDYQNASVNDLNKSRLIDYRLGDITMPKFEITEPLKSVVDEFYDCIIYGCPPLSNGENGLNVVRILEKAQESLRLNGVIIPV